MNNIKNNGINILVFLMLLLPLKLVAQIPLPECSNFNGDMESHIGTPGVGLIANNQWINDNVPNWYVSHGHPTPIFSPDNEFWMWSYEWEDETIGEGMYTNVAVTLGHTYTVTYDLWRDPNSNPDSEVFVKLCNGLNPFYIPPVGFLDLSIPAIPGAQTVSNEDWSSGTGSWVTITETITATNHFSQLWFYPSLDQPADHTPGTMQAAIKIDNVCIREVIPDPCAVVPHFTTSVGEWCHQVFENTSTYPAGWGLQVLRTSWDFGDGTTATGDIVSHAYADPGFYTITMRVWSTNGDDCCEVELTSTIEVTETCPACDVMIGTVIDADGGNPFTFTANTFPSIHDDIYHYYWDFGDGTLGTGKVVDHTYAIPGTYTVTLTLFYYDELAGECCSYTVTLDVVAGEVAIGGGGDDPGGWSPITDSESQGSFDGIRPQQSVNIFPNPGSGLITLQPQDEMEIETVIIYDMTGKVVFRESNTSDNRMMQVDLSHLEKGTYLVTINQGQTNPFIERLMIK